MTANAVRRYIEGVNSIVNVIPTPLVHKIGNNSGTAYVLLHDVLSLYLPYNIEIACNSAMEIRNKCNEAGLLGETKCYTETKRALSLLSNDNDQGSKKIFICLWSDGCDPNARTKTNRGSMHVTSVSILSDINHNDEQNTFVLAIGREGGDHSEVRRIIYDDIKRLQNGHSYYNGTNMVKLDVELFCHLADRPERSENTGYGYHNGEVTIRWGYVSSIPFNLPSCIHCLHNRVTNTERLKCNVCHDWDFAKIRTKVDKHYPTDVPEYNDGYVNSHKFTYRSAFDAAVIGMNKIKSKEWGIARCTAFLKHKGINYKVISKIITGSTADPLVTIGELVPTLWLPKYNFDIDNHVPAFMHLCFLGITQTVGMAIKELFNNYKSYSKFRDNDMMKCLRGFSLDWCRIWTYGSQTTPYGPWTAENYLAYSRTMKSIYSVSDRIIVNTRNHEERVLHVSLILQLVSSLNAMLSRIMQPVVTDKLIIDTDRHIKLFLSKITELDDLNIVFEHKKQTKTGNITEIKRKKRKINKTSNLTSLLNIPDFMKKYGPPRLYWEGGFKGEGLLRTIKPIVTQGTHMAWFGTSLLNRFYKDKSLSLLVSRSNDISTEEYQKYDSYADRKMYTYKNGTSQIVNDISLGNPLSAAVSLASGDIYCMAVIDKKKWMMRIEMADHTGVIEGNTYYTSIGIDVSKKVDPIHYNNLNFVLLLPNRQQFVDPANGEDYFYYCVSEHWKERTKMTDGSVDFVLPQMAGVMY